jgi:hypothetical protein
MRVQFHKTDERRYGIVILRDGSEPVRMRTAPGNDPLMPHDLQHFIVEQELASGSASSDRWRQVGRQARSTGILRTVRSGAAARSCRARAGTIRSVRSGRRNVCVFNWLAALPTSARRRRAAEMKEHRAEHARADGRR